MLGTALGGTVASGGKQNTRDCAQPESIFQKKKLSLRESNFVLQSQYKHKLQATNDFFIPQFSEYLIFEFENYHSSRSSASSVPVVGNSCGPLVFFSR